MRTFDPFSDRLARDLRNALSSALVDRLTGKGDDALDLQADFWRAKGLAPVYASFLEQQLESYRAVVAEIERTGHTDPRHQAVQLWNAGLFFELHELLETIWLKAPEPERTALKGMIQAAGAFVHNLRGKAKAAGSLALRARQHLKDGADALGYITNLDQLIDDLKQLPSEPTRLILAPSC
jgi:hypothetical protein